MLGVILFMALAFVVGWTIQHPLAWAVLLVPIAFVLAAGDDAAIFPAILGVLLSAAALLAGRAFARRHDPGVPSERTPREEHPERETDQSSAQGR